MDLKDIVFRKAKKEDYPTIMEFIRENYNKRWECENESTEKRLSRLLFNQYMSERDIVHVATYRGQVVGVIMTGAKGKLRMVSKIKKLFSFCRLKMTKDGRWNLDLLHQMEEIRNHIDKQKGEIKHYISFLYVGKNYRRHGIGTELLQQLEEKKNTSMYVYIDQEEKSDFMEKQGFSKVSYAWKMMELHKKRFRETISLYCKEKTEIEKERR